MKHLLSLGKTLSKVEQKQIFGGERIPFERDICDPGNPNSNSGIYLGKKCKCWRDGGTWNAMDTCCIVPHNILPGFYEATPCN